MVGFPSRWRLAAGLGAAHCTDGARPLRALFRPQFTDPRGAPDPWRLSVMDHALSTQAVADPAPVVAYSCARRRALACLENEEVVMIRIGIPVVCVVGS